MMVRRFFRNSDGAAAVEFVFALPLLATLMIGILQMGMMMHAYGGMRHALGEGIRFAKVNPTATDTAVLTRTRESLVGISQAGVTALSLQRQTVNDATYVRLTMQYKFVPSIPFVSIPAITMNETKTAYLPG